MSRKWLHRTPLLVVSVLLLIVTACGGSTSLTGTDLEKQPAPDFTLTDYRGSSVTLSELRGKAVVLTFIYTNCPDICPLTAENLRLAYEQLSEKARERVAMIAITVDPERDTPDELRNFSVIHGLDDNPNWYAVRGERTDLQPVWANYAVDPGRVLEHRDNAVDPALLAHTDAVYVIDRDGNERVLMRSNLDPDDLANNLKTLTS
jgi:protein SCO1/2